jgi:hypothetical protein
MSPTIPPFQLSSDKAEPITRATSVPPQEIEKRCGMRKRWFNIVFIVSVIWIVALGVALGVGLGIGLKKKHP